MNLRELPSAVQLVSPAQAVFNSEVAQYLALFRAHRRHGGFETELKNLRARIRSKQMKVVHSKIEPCHPS